MTPTLSTVSGSAPYPWPYDASVPCNHTALLVCGWDRSWAGRVADARNAASQVGRLTEAIAALGGHIVATSHPDQTGSPSSPLALESAEHVVAAGIDGFYASPLDDVLRRRHVTHLLLVGHGFEATVHSTLRSANDRGYECLVVTDACSNLDPGMVARTVSMIHMSGGIFGATAHTADVLAAVVAGADPHPVHSSPRRFR